MNPLHNSPKKSYHTLSLELLNSLKYFSDPGGFVFYGKSDPSHVGPNGCHCRLWGEVAVKAECEVFIICRICRMWIVECEVFPDVSSGFKCVINDALTINFAGIPWRLDLGVQALHPEDPTSWDTSIPCIKTLFIIVPSFFGGLLYHW